MQEDKIINDRKKFIVLLSIAFVLAVAAISFGMLEIQKNPSNVTALNDSTVKNNDRVLNDGDIDFLKGEIRNIAQRQYGIKSNQNVDFSIRDASYKEIDQGGGRIAMEFYIDVPTIKTTYYVWLIHEPKTIFEVALSCASPEEAMYPEVFCVGTQNGSSINAIFDGKLPYNARDEKGKLKFTIKTEQAQPRLELKIFNRCGDEETRQKYIKEAEAWIKEQAGPVAIPTIAPEKHCIPPEEYSSDI